MKLNIHIYLVMKNMECTDPVECDEYYQTYTVPCTPALASNTELLNTYVKGVLLENHWTHRWKDKEDNYARAFICNRDPKYPNMIVAKCRYELEAVNA